MYDPINGCVMGEVGGSSVFYVGDPLPEQPENSFQIQTTSNWPWCGCYHYVPTKSAREQVQDEILTKMAEAVERNDLKEAKKLVELAKALKEL